MKIGPDPTVDQIGQRGEGEIEQAQHHGHDRRQHNNYDGRRLGLGLGREEVAKDRET